MEDNIRDMMDDIRSVVSNHLSDQKYEWKETFDVLNTLPLVIELRAQIRKLEDENKKLKILFSTTNEKKNIELEILEVKKDKSLEDNEMPTHFFDFPTESAEDTDDEEAPIKIGEAHDTDEEEEEDELAGEILPSTDSQNETHVLTLHDLAGGDADEAADPAELIASSEDGVESDIEEDVMPPLELDTPTDQ